MDENSDKSNSEKTNSKELSERNKNKTNLNELSERFSDVTQRSTSSNDDVDPTQDSISPANSDKDKKKEEFGEQLSGFADDEWQDSAPAFDPELINVKANTSKPTVFQASHLIVEKEKVAPKPPFRRRRRSDIKPTTALEKSPIVPQTLSVTTLVPPKADVSSPFEVEDKATLIGRLLADVVRLYLQGKQDQDVQVELSLIQKNSVAVSASYSSPLPETKVLDCFTGSPSSTSSSAELYPPKASAPTAKSVSSIVTALEGIDESELPQMVPELKKLIKALKASNLSREDFNEISEQLDSNKDVEQPRENTSPAPTAPSEGPPSEKDGESRGIKIPNEKRDKATDRNLAALRSALSDQIVRKVMRGDQPAPVVISLQRPHSHPRQVDRPSSATRLQRLNSNLPAKVGHREGGEQDDTLIESTTAKAKVFAVTAHARRVLPERSHRQVGHISQGNKVQAGVANQESRVSSSSENSDRVQLDDATGEQAQPKSAASFSNLQSTTPVLASSTTASPQPQLPTQHLQQQYSGGQQQQYTYNNQNGNYQPSNNNNYYSYQQQQQPVWYPQYGAWYYPQQLQQQYSGGQQQQQYYYQTTTPRTQPARMAPEPVQTTPSSVLHHPFGHGALLTLMQPNQMFGRK